MNVALIGQRGKKKKKKRERGMDGENGKENACGGHEFFMHVSCSTRHDFHWHKRRLRKGSGCEKLINNPLAHSQSSALERREKM